MKTPSSGSRSNVTLLLLGRLLNPASSSLPHVADFNGIRHGWDLRDPQEVRWVPPFMLRKIQPPLGPDKSRSRTSGMPCE